MSQSQVPSASDPLIERVAFGISAVTSPYVVTATVAAAVVWLLHPTVSQLLLWGFICVMTGAVIPFLIVFLLWRQKRLTDIHVAVREQREVPFLAALGSGAMGVYGLYELHAPPELVALGVVYLANGLLLMLISRRWKISVHVAVLTAGLLAVASLGYAQALWGLLAVPLTLWARVHRGKHTLMQGLVPVLMTAVVTPGAFYAAMIFLAGYWRLP